MSLPGTARVVVRAAALSILTVAGLLAVGAARLAGGPGGTASGVPARILKWWARAASAILGMRLRVKGPLPEGAFLLVANHLGYVDIVALASHLDCTFVARADLTGWPVLGLLSRAVGTLYVHRERPRLLPSAVEGIAGALRAGRGIVVFPEGTSTAGDGVLRFRSPLLEAAAREQRPVHHARIRYRTLPGTPPAGDAVCWWGEMTFWRHLGALLAQPGFAARVTFGPSPVTSEDRKVLAEALWTQVQSRLRHPAC